MKKYLLIPISLLIFNFSCIDTIGNDIEYKLPNIETIIAQKVSLNEARIGVDVIEAELFVADVQAGRQTSYTDLGFVWGTDENLDMSCNKVELEPEFGTFYTTLTNLSKETSYFYQPFAINANDEIEYGTVDSFTTHGDVPCVHSEANYIESVYQSYQPLTIDEVELVIPGWIDNGNLQFIAKDYSSIVRILVNVYEENRDMPLSGTYTGVYEFGPQADLSINEVIVQIQDYNGFPDLLPQGGVIDYGDEIYIETTESEVTFIFCDVPIGAYIVNGEFTYLIP